MSFYTLGDLGNKCNLFFEILEDLLKWLKRLEAFKAKVPLLVEKTLQLYHSGNLSHQQEFALTNFKGKTFEFSKMLHGTLQGALLYLEVTTQNMTLDC